MFDVSFTELMLIGVVALVVIGPERLPKVARTAGHLLGRAQRYVTDVKGDIQRELDLDEMNKLKKQMDDAAQSLQSSMRETSASIQNPLEEARKSLTEASSSMENLMEQARREVTPTASDSTPETPPATPEPVPEPAAQAVPAPADAPEPEPLGTWETMPESEQKNTDSSGKT